MIVKDLPLSDAILRHMEQRLERLPSQFNPMVHLQLDPAEIDKAGILPTVMHKEQGKPYFCYYVMKPRPKHLQSKGQPLFQIAKGTRHYRGGSGEEEWTDSKDKAFENIRPLEAEPLLRTALREGMEEIALEPLAIQALFDFGPVAFRSERTAIGKSMWLYVAQFTAEVQLPPIQSSHPTTEEGRWCTLQEFRHFGRPDHLLILAEVEKALIEYFSARAQTR